MLLPSRSASTARIPGFLAIWNGFYMAGVYLAVTTISGQSPSALALGIAWLTGQGAYLLDRVKPSRRFDDPADRQADPERADFLDRHARTLRIWVVAAFLLAILGATQLQVFLTGPVAAAFAGAFLYGSSPRARPRPKDIPAIKNLLVGGAVACFAATLAWADAGALAPALFASILLLPVVTVDALLCDLPDRASDREYGTFTLADAMGSKKAQTVAVLVLLFVMIAAAIADPPFQRRAAWLFFGTLLVTTPWVVHLQLRYVRDAIDLRLPLAAMLVYFAILGGM